MMPGIMPTVWRCRLGPGHKAPRHRCSSQLGALGEFRGADLLPRDHPHPWMQLFSTALHCTPARWSCRFIAHAPSNRGQALLGARTFPGELNPLLSLGHLCLAGILLFSLCCGGEQDLGTPYPEPSTLPEGAPADPFLPIPLSSCGSSPRHAPKQVWGKAGLARHFTSTALGLCHRPALATSSAPPVPRAMSAVPWLHYVPEPGADPILMAWPAERRRRAQTYLSAGAELTHAGLSHRGGITRHGQRLQETALTWCKHIPALCRGQAASGVQERNQTRSDVFH